MTLHNHRLLHKIKGCLLKDLRGIQDNMETWVLLMVILWVLLMVLNNLLLPLT
jgi:hypothetical protein